MTGNSAIVVFALGAFPSGRVAIDTVVVYPNAIIMERAGEGRPTSHAMGELVRRIIRGLPEAQERQFRQVPHRLPPPVYGVKRCAEIP
jgi:hypothetical protein